MYEKVDNWFDIISLEHNILKFWKENNIFNKLREKNKGKEKWSFLDGPITANNPMGVHHAWGRALKDVYQRYWAMNGRELRYQNGFDCQGLWVEVEVEKELGFKTKKDIEDYGIDRFVNKCKERVKKFSKIQTEQSIRLGYWMDWDNSYYTMTDENNYTIWLFLKKCFEKGLIYKGHDVMPWCPRCGTGISQHEMHEGYKEVKHLSVTIKFPVTDKKNEFFLVWTTTPWTLTSNVAIAVNPDLEYVKVKQDNDFYYLVKEKTSILDSKGEWEIVETIKGEDLAGRNLKYSGPFDELPAQKNIVDSHKIILWKEVSSEEGTGIVHIAPGCGAEDFALGKEFNLPALCPIDEAGYFIEGFDWITGQHASEVALDIMKNLHEKGILYLKEQYKHSYPHCWRCSTELLFRLVDEWFISMDPWRDKIKNVAKQIKWIPSFGLDLELDWLTNMRDWMISKKRFWGLALPIWDCISCNKFYVIGGYDELKEKAVQGWEEFDGNSPHRPWIDNVKIKCPDCGKIISRVKDVGNPWLDAGIVPYSTVNYNSDRDYWKKWIPADLVLECFPGQFRNWFYSLLAMSTMMEGIAPFKTLVGHSLVRDEDGNEMHKSKGNAIWFEDAAEKMGTEIMRWMFFSHDILTNLNFGYKEAKMLRGKFFNTFWNCYAFYANYARLIDYKPPEKSSEITERTEFDRWIISKLQTLIKNCRAAIEEYNVRKVCQYIDEFMENLSNWYIRNNRRRYWRSELDKDTLFAFETMFDCLYTVIRLTAPLLPMFTEEMYQNIVRNISEDYPESVHLTEYPEVNEVVMDSSLEYEMDTVIKIYSLALSAREKAHVKIRQPLNNLIISPNDEAERKSVERFKQLLTSNLNVKNIEITEIGKECPSDIEIKPNKQKIGPKFKGDAGKVMRAIEEQKDRIKLEVKNKKKEIVLSLHEKDEMITPDDLLIEEVSPPDLSVVEFNKGWLAFDTVITEELELEGLMRDFLRQMQVFRKDIGLEIEDRIEIIYNKVSDKLEKAIEQHKEFICSELLCLKLEKTDLEKSEHEIKLGTEFLSFNLKTRN